jgi:hypothetical protein
MVCKIFRDTCHIIAETSLFHKVLEMAGDIFQVVAKNVVGDGYT